MHAATKTPAFWDTETLASVQGKENVAQPQFTFLPLVSHCDTHLSRVRVPVCHNRDRTRLILLKVYPTIMVHFTFRYLFGDWY